MPYHLSAPTQAIAVAALRHTDTMLGTVGAIKEQRDRIGDRPRRTRLPTGPQRCQLRSLRWWPLRRRRDLVGAAERGVLVRDVGIPHYLSGDGGNPAETTAFPTRWPSWVTSTAWPDERTHHEDHLRTASRERATSESSVTVRVDLDGTGRSSIITGIGFWTTCSPPCRAAPLIDLDITATGDTHIDAHHGRGHGDRAR